MLLHGQENFPVWGGLAKRDFIGFAILAGTLFPCTGQI